ncbi:hypothetical protein [Streptomyces sp. NPDC053560]|uniref:hypothetical protein n=1 Tax=Streptomyces sp. NPDC053560 TaxID=3365711 RepID=UPI0037CCDE4E
MARWPGRLFRAQIVPPATQEERIALASAAEDLSPHAGYTRALAIDLLEELSASVLFGPHGDAVRQVLEAGCALDEDEARRLATARPAAADHAYSTAWDRWLAEQPQGASQQGTEHAGVVAVSGVGPAPSPIGHGLSVLAHTVDKSARLRGGTGAHTTDADGEEVLLDPWHTACAALLDTAMALGAPHLTDDRTRTLLTTAWTTTYGPAIPPDSDHTPT